MGLDFGASSGQTPLEEEEKEGLLIPAIATREELDEFEQQNIEEAFQWMLGKTFRAEKVFSEKFVRDIHRRMFKQVWRWAGSFRHSQKNIGIDYWLIQPELSMLLEDASLWFRESVFAPDELALRFKHRIVSIHCFSNGNGRHSRLMADIIVEKLFMMEPFSWGEASGDAQEASRRAYLQALKDADEGSMESLLKFARS